MEKKKPKQLYFKLFWTYTVIVVSIVAALTVYFISVSRQRILESNQADMVRICEAATGYLKETEEVTDYIYKELYRSKSELEDLLAYFQLEPEAYQNYSLNRYVSTDELVYKGIYSFITETFEAYTELEKVELIGHQDFRMTECYPEKIFYPGKDGKQRIYQIQSKSYEENGRLVYIKNIRDPDTMELAGYLVFTFEGKKAFQDIQKSSPYTEMVVHSENDFAVFQGTKSADWGRLLKDEQYYVVKEAVNDYNIYTFLDKKEASYLPPASFFAILGSGILAVLLGISCINYYVRHLTRRVESILDAMNQVTTGNLQVRLNVEKNQDELDMVAANFNNMCEKLELYIQKSYLAEIERKNAQMQALQSQINPHFLYNTLEAIRMKAICNGDREVGRMLYSMVVLFRSQLKEADIITLGQELDYCKQYLELFEYRYQGTFQFKVECRPELLAFPIIKFVLQPIIENYFIHGIQRDRTDNAIRVWAERRDECLRLYVEDNGCGMEAADIERKNRELKENLPDEKGKKSIGITNVNRRIKAVYGEEYGISIEPAEAQGLRVIITIKIEERKEHEEGHVSGR